MSLGIAAGDWRIAIYCARPVAQDDRPTSIARGGPPTSAANRTVANSFRRVAGSFATQPPGLDVGAMVKDTREIRPSRPARLARRPSHTSKSAPSVFTLTTRK